MPSNHFDSLIDELATASQRRVPPPQQRSMMSVAPIRLPSSHPSADLRKSTDAIIEDAARSVLRGMRPGMAVACPGRPGVHHIVDCDAAGGRVKVRLSRDPANSPAGVNFDDPPFWQDVDGVTRAPEHDLGTAGNGSFAQTLALSSGMRESEAKVAEIRARARALVTAKRAALSAALADGSMSAMDAIQNESLLNAFCERMGL